MDDLSKKKKKKNANANSISCIGGTDCWGVFDLPESESGFEIMILIHRFI